MAFSFENFEAALSGSYEQPFKKSYWNGAALYISCLIQQKMQRSRKNKGLTVLIFDDNKKEMPDLSDSLHEASPWFDPLYQTRRTLRKKTVWEELTPARRFDQIVNTAFALKSQHSSLVQIADAVAYIHRRNLELITGSESWAGEKNYIAGLVGKLPRSERLGRTPGGHASISITLRDIQAGCFRASSPGGGLAAHNPPLRPSWQHA
ncbi:DUF3800 domain-containing protein [Bradyrhizobium sp. HKCCYLRH2057]|uniref:DUF3800 domain-containing protein n=1 Tax=Bradyrhizobium sp. HKCCYLRH2057 TaxID=3420763 RepID=UPI003EC00081